MKTLKTLSRYMVLPTALSVVLFSAGSASAFQQETADVIIVNEDGEVVRDGQFEIQIAEDREGSDSFGEVEDGSSISIEDNRILITGPDGDEREIDLSGATSISISQSMKSVNENGQQQTERTGTAVIIDRNGERHELALTGDVGDELSGIGMGNMRQQFGMIFDARGAGNLPEGIRVFESLPERMVFTPERMPGFRIGVIAEPVNDQLRAHLDISPEVGLVIHSVVDGPAKDAGVQQHDIMIYADDTELKEVNDLTAVIEEAGEDGDSISVTVVRNGGEVEIAITPVESSEITGPMAKLNNVPMNMEMRQIGPGIIQGRVQGNVDDLHDLEMELSDLEMDNENQFKRMQKQMEQMQLQHQRLMEEQLKMMEEMEKRINDGR